ncbi:hypothetical protein BT67DRAFT_440163 [Trichocladium antarcticum]|uniref:BTB domain-containing protein n=1 Tax=Trichocladium antarcticum TaxID=1450529 RepID=A0AAN6ZFX1_9PEZI|nr:hypothetical protein BT67DRAFT_440163 [Trichocladium antarcticum]
MAEFYNIDPSGDVTIILRDADAPFAEAPALFGQPPDKPRTGPKKKKKKIIRKPANPPVIEAGLATVAEDAASVDGSKEPGIDLPLPEPPVIRLRVSSRHLIVASCYFRTALSGRWKETASTAEDGSLCIEAHGWDPQALKILMLVIHGCNRQVPRLLSLELLAKIAVLVDYYKCAEAVEVFAELWLRALKGTGQAPITEVVNRDLVLWLFVSWIFGDDDVFTAVARTALWQTQEPLPTLGLPIPDTVIATIDRKRLELIDGIITGLHELLATFRDGPESCSFECSSMLLGALTKEMRAKGLDPKPGPLPSSSSVVATIDVVRSIHSPQWISVGEYVWNTDEIGLIPHSCCLQTLIQSKVLDGLDERMGGLTLDEFGGRRSLWHPRVLWG